MSHNFRKKLNKEFLWHAVYQSKANQILRMMGMFSAQTAINKLVICREKLLSFKNSQQKIRPR
jgi:hypothetical protein